ncbi:UPF0262 family protein [Euryhalocaulis caribicus]|uniref:UPF0262 family protein n=1 Tax=Euryhalocaulis caribicus TaxID=1161401 RepID=UPI0003A98BFA|nr:UPF0262 family protein [Euryhalocaulis caribicus]
MSDSAEHKLVAVRLDKASLAASSADAEHERRVAIYDLLEENSFKPKDSETGPYELDLSLADQRLVMAVSRPEGEAVHTFVLSLSPFRGVIKDYFMICESYYEAIRTAAPSRIEAIDMGRRGLHNEGSELLQERLSGKVEVDFDTARRLFTLICALSRRGVVT